MFGGSLTAHSRGKVESAQIARDRAVHFAEAGVCRDLCALPHSEAAPFAPSCPVHNRNMLPDREAESDFSGGAGHFHLVGAAACRLQEPIPDDPFIFRIDAA
jgi:hypothetical protein